MLRVNIHFEVDNLGHSKSSQLNAENIWQKKLRNTEETERKQTFIKRKSAILRKKDCVRSGTQRHFPRKIPTQTQTAL